MNKAVFLDRDGVINHAPIVGNKAFSPRKLKEVKILPKVKEAIHILKKKNFFVIEVTNQPDISRGLLETADLEEMNNYLKSELEIDDILMCLHDDIHSCNCRKPKPGLLLQAKEKWDIDFAQSYLVGDRWRDIEAGKAVGCKTILIESSANGVCEPDYVADSLYKIIDLISPNA